LAALVLVAGAIIALYAWGKARERAQAPRPVPARAEPTGNLVLKGEGFDYQVTRDQRPLFRIRGQKILSDRSQNVVLRGVHLTFFRAEGEPLELRSRQGTYQVGSEEATLEGNVSVATKNGVTLHASKAKLTDKGRKLTSVGSVSFEIAPDLQGKADHLRADLKRGIYELLGNIEIKSRPGAEHLVEITTSRVRVTRALNLVRMSGGVRFRRDQLSYEAPVASLFFSGPHHHLRFVRGRWGVHVKLYQQADDGDNRTIDGVGWDFSLALDPQGSPLTLALESQPQGSDRVTLKASAASGQMQSLVSPYVDAQFKAGKLSSVHSAPPSSLRESFTFAPDFTVRMICSDTIDASFEKSGDLGKIDLFGGVDVHQGMMQGRGNRGAFDPVADRLQLQGSPAEVLSERGDLTAPQVVSTGSNLTASGGVELTSRGDSSELLLPAASSAAPEAAHLVAESAQWSESPPIYKFEGRVRSWRGDDLLLADRIEGNTDQKTLVASGAVKTVWRPAATQTSSARGSSGNPVESQPVEVTADALAYDQTRRTLTYTGSPRARQGSRILSCGQLQASESAAGRIDRLVCTGGAQIDDPESHRQVHGDQAVYLPQTSEATVTGNPVRLKDAEGTEIKGQKLIYNLSTGAIEMKAEGEGNQTKTDSTPPQGTHAP